MRSRFVPEPVLVPEPVEGPDHAFNRRSASMRLPTVSALGLSRSCGSVSQAGNSTISASGTTLASAEPSASASRLVAVIASSVCGPSRRSSRRGQKRRTKPVDE